MESPTNKSTETRRAKSVEPVPTDWSEELEGDWFQTTQQGVNPWTDYAPARDERLRRETREVLFKLLGLMALWVGFLLFSTFFKAGSLARDLRNYFETRPKKMDVNYQHATYRLGEAKAKDVGGTNGR